MRFRRLNLKAFGGFTDREFDFGDGSKDLHIILGPNEAGKSTMLAALGDLLFGIDPRSPHNYVHEHSRMRLEATIEDGGSALEFIRRKGKKGTLLDPNDNTLPDDSLDPFVSGDRNLFFRMFGLSHETLRQGGKDILEAKGDVGRTLFEASSGIANLGHELKRLEEASDAIFKGRAKTATLNKAVFSYKESNKETRDSVHRMKEWNSLTADLQKAKKIKEELAKKRQQVNAETEKLERVKRSRPKFVRWDELFRELEELEGVQVLPPDFGEQFSNARDAQSGARAIEATNKVNLDSLQVRRNRISINNDILSQRDEISVLNKIQSKAQSGEIDLPSRESDYKGKIGESRILMMQIGISSGAEEFDSATLPTVHEVAHIRGVVKKFDKLSMLVGGSQKELLKAEKDAAKTEKQIEMVEDCGDSISLRRVISVSRLHGDLELSHRTKTTLVYNCEKAIGLILPILGLSRDQAEKLPSMTVVTRDEVAAALEKLSEIDATISDCRSEIDKIEVDLAGARKDLATQESQGSVPTREDLDEHRSVRDEAWEEIKSSAASNQISNSTTFDKMESAMLKADDTSNRMIAEASRVAEAYAAMRTISEREGKMTQIEANVTKADEAREAWFVKWEQVWRRHGWAAPKPLKANDWLEKYGKALELLNNIERGQEEVDETKRTIDEDRQKLIDALQTARPGDRATKTRKEVLAEAEEIASTMEAQQAKLATLKQLLAEQSGDVSEAQETVKASEEETRMILAEWDGFASNSSLLAGDVHIEEVEPILAPIESLRTSLGEAASFKHRVDAMKRDIQIFTEKVISLKTLSVFEHLEGTSDQISVAMTESYEDAVLAKEKADGLDEQVAEAEEGLEASVQAVRSADEEIKRLCKEAGVNDPNEIAAVIIRCERSKELNSNLNDLKSDLSLEGLSFDNLRVECEAVDGDTLETRIKELEEESDTVDLELEDAAKNEQQFQTKESEILEAHGSADPEQKSIQDLDVIVEEAERYLKLKTAARLLRWAIDQHRLEKQGPLLTGASRLFQLLTVENYNQLKVELDDTDHAHLIGVMENGDHVGVDAMSDGARDQLYLAIRLSAIEQYVERNPTKLLPFIADDLLVHFDDAREEATFRTLDRLSQKTQVMIFTHHPHLVEAAERALGSDAFLLHKM